MPKSDPPTQASEKTREADARAPQLSIGNAPCSWGTIENTARPGGAGRVPYTRMLDELAETGYAGTELGDWGFMPTDPKKLREELGSRGLKLTGSWVTVRLYDRAHHAAGVERAVRVARLLAEVGGPDATVNIGDDHSSVFVRSSNTGRITPEHALSEEGWQVYAEGVTEVAEAVTRETGLRTLLHPHGATYVETPAEIDTFLSLTDPKRVGIVFDTGHYALGGGDSVAGLERYAGRVGLVHLKDFDPSVVARAKAAGWDYPTMIGHGLFSELGRGVVDFPAVLEVLNRLEYRGWAVVEQDVLAGTGSPKESARRNREYLGSLGI